jgi:hypothetical protein
VFYSKTRANANNCKQRLKKREVLKKIKGKKTNGETFNLLPFSKKTISLKRIEDID